MKTSSMPVKKVFFIVLAFSAKITAQTISHDTVALSLQQAVTMAQANNKTITIAKTDELAATMDYKDVKNGMLPTFSVSGNYQRFSKITLYENGLTESNSIDKRPDPNVAGLGVDMVWNLYAGGKQRSVVEENRYKKQLTSINTEEQAGNVGVQTAAQYLDLVRLYYLKKLIADQRKRFELRLKNITAFYNTQRITRSDLLRAEVALSNVILSQSQNDNDIDISNQKLTVLLDIDQTSKITPIDTIMSVRPKNDLAFENFQNPYPLQKIDMNLKIQSARIKNLQANYFPTLLLVSAYGFNYPNNLFPVPVAQTYAAGYAGVRLSYNISSIYQNRNKVNALKLRDSELKLQKDWVSDNIHQEVEALNIKYDEAIERIKVTEKSMEQSKVNLDITNTKYLNQLALLTDLLDADNLYQETRYNYINAQTAALNIYYRLLFTKGLL